MHQPDNTSSACTHVRSHQGDNELLQLFARQAIGVNRTFANLAPLLFRTRLLAFNAEIASARVGESGASFGIVVKELLAMCDDLSNIVENIEQMFARIANCVGIWIQSRSRLEMYLRVLDALDGQDEANAANTDTMPDTSTRHPLAGTSLLQATGALSMDQQRQHENISPARRQAQRMALTAQTRAIENITVIDTASSRLTRLLDQVNYVGTLQSRYLATTSRMEASHADQSAFDLSGVVSHIEDLAKDFTDLQADATSAVLQLNATADRVMRILRRN